MPNKYESLNLGKGDGAAYRGRVLLEVRTELLSDPVANEVRAIDNDSIARVQKVLRRRRFRVHAAFLSASLIPGEKDSPIQFEVSVGNYGNILDDSVPPCASTTPPTNPVYDGVAYSYLPWGEEKPMCLLESHWEDVTYRMCAVNVLLKAADRMTNSITRVQLSVKNDFPLEQQARDVIDALDQFILDCSVELPVSEPEQSPTNELDMHLRILREGQLKSLHDQAVHLRNTAEDIEQTLQQMIFFRDTLLGIAAEPQLSFPDVIIWMLSGSKRSAYCRIPAHDVMYHPNPNYCGRACGVPQTLMFKRPKLEEESGERYLRAPVMVRVIVWLGLDKYQQAWNEATVEARTQIVAETYENQGKILNKWVTTKPPLTRPAWSDAQGKKELKKESFVPPPGWRWDGDWFVHPDVSILYHKDTNQTSFVEDVYVNQSRTPNGNWEPAQIPYSDAYGEPKRAPENIQLRDDWTWEGDWEVDKDRLCDEDGWEYAQGSTDTTFTSAEKNYCMFRRKRMIRKRVKGEAGMPVKQAILGSVLSQDKEQRVALLESFSGVPEERWEYAFNFSSKFHDREKTMDAVRRRRWHRIMVPGGDESGSVVMQLKAEDKPAEHTQKTRKKKNMTVPRIYLQYERSHIWHLRVYLFQARNLLAADQSGMSDPYVQCSFQGMCQRTPTLQGTICPVFDQTIMYEQVEMHGSVTRITRYPPPVVLEFFDWDKVGTNEYLGRCQILPVIKTDISEKHAARLQWFSITKGDRDGGELLAAAELLLLDGRDPPAPPKRRGDLYAVPDNVRPVLRRKGIEILCWGVRNMAKYQLASVNSPSVEFEINGVVRESNVIKSVKHHPNFKDPFLFLDVMLPEEPAYMPPLNISVRDHRAFGQKPRVGIHVLQDMSSYQVDPRTTKFDPILNIPSLAEPVPAALDSGPQPTPTETGKPSKDAKLTKKKKFLDLEQIDDDVDWWSKLYASLGEWDRCLKYNELGYDKLKVYTKELEKVKEFRGFLDFCNTFTLTKGKNVDEDEDNFAGEFKGNFRIYDLPEDPTSPLPMRYFDQSNLCTDPEEVVVRVYVVRGMDLQPSDPSGLADPYVEVRIGDKKVNSKKNYVPNTLNPEFGRMFQLKVRLPIEKDLKIRVMDYDVIGADDVIGETTIDLENRRLTKYRATCGVPQSYCISGPNQWRDSKTPTAILEDVCKLYNLPSPQYDEPTDQNMPISCRVGNRNLSLDQFERGMIYNAHLGPAKERLALHILNMLPIVKEHVETRSLYSSLQPNTPQGQLQMWVDIFPVAFGEPGPAVDITPRVPDEYVLRVVVWNTYEVILQEANIFGEKMSDIYVKGWISGVDERQKTDVHYRSLDGEGNFNWRFVFPFLYLPSENMVVVKKKEHFWSLDTRETRCRPSLVMQVWDNDLFNPDDFLGTLELQLSNMPIPAKNAKSCNLNMMNSVSQDMKMVNLFDCKRVKGFWPFMNEDHGNQVLTGKIEMEMEVVTKAEEAVRPAGRARDEVNENPHLEPPNRPETSFLWFTSPWKTFKFIIWKKCKWIFIGILIAVLLGLLIALFIYAIPQLLARKMVGV
ncbi:Myoferlin [Fasciola hepatica]|uniref:Myoferlin n=1 Tax=Fasciola hepatica TaxID=6192 RepID=A0A4E0RXP6_FASHE|nr:Myoferlin [Fasciola hepatica]